MADGNNERALTVRADNTAFRNKTSLVSAIQRRNLAPPTKALLGGGRLARKAQWAGQEAMTVCSLLANGSKNFSLPGFWEQESKPTSAKATDEFVENSNK